MWPRNWLGKSLLLAAKVAALAVSCNTLADEWPSYGGDAGGMRYSPLTQINRDNVSRLKVAWGFQLVHHDLWDYDSASPPLLATIERNGKKIPVVVQGNKTGLLYVLKRDTGEPVFPVEERPVPPSDVPGEMASPTQPFPLAPPPLVSHRLSADQAWAVSDAEREACLERLRALRNEGIFTPPSLQGTLVIPGNLGGPNWSGYAFDPGRNLLLANVNNLPAKVRLVPRAEFEDYKHRSEGGEYTAQAGTPYGLFRNFIQAPSDLPCSPPPWGLLTAVDLASFDLGLRWNKPYPYLPPSPGTLAWIIYPVSSIRSKSCPSVAPTVLTSAFCWSGRHVSAASH
jgi:quinoprotein glucose dehydrogenase